MTFTKDNVIDENEVFQSINFPLLASELAIMKNELKLVPIYFKPDIIISFLKNHSIKNEWIKANPELTKLMTSGDLVTTQIESIFKGCIKHEVFLNDFESYMRKQIMN